MAKKNERTKGNSGKRASNQKASSLAVNTSKKMDRTGVVAGCVPRKNRRPRARHPPASPASPEKIKSPEKSPGRPRPRVSSPLSNKRKKVSRAQREKRPSQVTATPPAGLKKSGLKRPPRHPTAKTGLKPVSTVPSSSPTKRNRGRNNNKRARSPRRATARNTDKLTTVTNGAVTKKKPRRVRFKNVPGAPINSTRKIIHRYNNRKNKVKPASSLASPRLSRHGGGVVLERLLKGQIDTYGTHLRRSARLTPSRCGSPAPSMMFSPMRGDSTPGREEWYADNLPEDVFTCPGERESAGVREYDEWVDGVVETPVPRPEYLTSPRVQWTPRSPAPHR